MTSHGRLIDADALMQDINNSLDEMTKIGISVDADWLWAKLNDALENAPPIEPERKNDDFKKGLHQMFDHIWDCEIEHPVFQDTVGDLMKAVIQLYNNTIEPGRKIGYRECADAMLMMWMDNVLTDAEYNRIMDKLNTKYQIDMKGEQND